MSTYAYIRVGETTVARLQEPLHESAFEFFNASHFHIEQKEAEEFSDTRLVYRIEADHLARRMDTLGYTPDFCREILKKAIIHQEKIFNRNPYTAHFFEDESGTTDVNELVSMVLNKIEEINSSLISMQAQEFEIHRWSANIIENELDRIYVYSIYDLGFAPITRLLIDGFGGDVEFDVSSVFEWEIDESEIHNVIRDADDRFLILTEGTSDRKILERSISHLYPEIEDLFYFADESLPIPQAGAARITELLKALASLKIKTKIIAVFDNDAEGSFEARYAAEFCRNHENIEIVTLPELVEFENIVCQGPDGRHVTDINKRAGSIEMYLERPPLKGGEPEVKWSSYLKKSKTWQGEPVHKGEIVDHFFRTIENDTYATEGIEAVLEAVFSAAGRIGERLARKILVKELIG
jgi:hypothetical protein